LNLLNRVSTDTAEQPAASLRHPQVAALCYRLTDRGKQVLLVTSRGTGRWIVPKGWPMTGLEDPQAALQEAWEEAGVKSADVSRAAIGAFNYDKLSDDGEIIPVRAKLFAAKVKKLEDTYPEHQERKRRWFTPDEAATRVAEPQLQALLRGL
jgi:8-oxo-dGTP pyrophosphatase MutT (NUDIX family)